MCGSVKPGTNRSTTKVPLRDSFPPLGSTAGRRDASPSVATMLIGVRQLGVSPETLKVVEEDAWKARAAQRKPGTKLNVAEGELEKAQKNVKRLWDYKAYLRQQLKQTSQ